uniref:EGF-like domain-containing protein n=1 Tax=Biomphalaria glabrata TaxID=6526 RepID=A0A2C9LA96_BIOGL
MWTGAIVTWSWVCFFFGHVGADNSCSAGWFGNYCQYKCHCKNSTCDTNGDCVGTTPCERGWFGYKCQYQDLSSLADTSQQRLIDGDDSTCNEDLNVTSVSFNLKTPFLFSWMRLVFRLKEPLKKLTIEFKTMNDTRKCQDPRILQGSDTTFDIYCTISVKIQVINITGDSTKYLCSVYLSGVGLSEQLIDLGLHSEPSSHLWLQAVVCMRQRPHPGKPSRLTGQTRDIFILAFKRFRKLYLEIRVTPLAYIRLGSSNLLGMVDFFGEKINLTTYQGVICVAVCTVIGP